MTTRRSGKSTGWHEGVSPGQNGNKSSEGDYKDGKRHGKWVEWHKNGQKKSEGTYVEGQKEGEWREWSESGRTCGISTYRDGEFIGDSITYGRGLSPRRPGTYLYDTYIVEYYIVFIRIGHTDTDYFTPSEMMKLWFLAHFGGIGRVLGSFATLYKLPFSFLTLLYYQSKARAHLRESIDQDLDSSANDQVDGKTESLLAEVGWKKNSQTGKWMPPSK